MDILADARALLQTVDGISRYSLNMIRSISALRPDWSISVFVPRKAAYHLKGVQVLNVIEDTPRFSLNERIQLAPLIDSLKPDVYVNFSMAGPCPRAPSIVTVHDLMVLNIPDYFDNTLLRNYLSRSLFKILVSRSVRHAERIAVPSEATRNEVSQTYRRTRDKIFITGEGQNLFECSGTGGSERKNFLLYVGNARSYKNLPRLLTAYKGILKEDSNFPELVMVIRKDRAYDGFIELLSSLDLSSSVKVMSHLPEDQLRELYATCKALLMPSIQEGFGLPALEAMATGTQVLTSRNTALAELVGDTGLLIDPMSVDDIASGIRKISSDPFCTTERARKTVERASGFTWCKAAQKLIDVLEQIV
jgi:glycosyltransferase involved in cell wall biosynthesis